MQALRRVCAPGRTEVLLAYEYRGESCRSTFFARAELFFHLERVPEDQLHPAYRADDIEFYRLRLRSEPLPAPAPAAPAPSPVSTSSPTTRPPASQAQS